MRAPGTGKVKQQVTHRCGHVRTVRVFESKSLETWRAELEASDCSACWLKKQPPVFSLRTAAAGPAIDVSLGYPIREELKERGYYFRRPTWTKWFHTEAERQEELAWARDCGYPIKEH